MLHQRKYTSLPTTVISTIFRMYFHSKWSLCQQEKYHFSCMHSYIFLHPEVQCWFFHLRYIDVQVKWTGAISPLSTHLKLTPHFSSWLNKRGIDFRSVFLSVRCFLCLSLSIWPSLCWSYSRVNGQCFNSMRRGCECNTLALCWWFTYLTAPGPWLI